MGRLILCAGTGDREPYVFPDSQVEVYTLEEMSYYIYNNIEVVTDETFGKEMLDWLFAGKDTEPVAKKLVGLVENGNSLKDKVVTLLCGCDYYREEEIRGLIGYMDEMEGMSFFGRYKARGIHYMESGRYKEAERLFSGLLGQGGATSLTAEEYGDTLHELAVIHTHTASYGEAAGEFRAAYAKNRRRESLEQYLIALRLSDQDELYEREAARLEADEELKAQVEGKIERKMREAEDLLEFRELRELAAMKEDGQVGAYYEETKRILEGWKREYKEMDREA